MSNQLSIEPSYTFNQVEPGSELFVVYNEQRDTLTARFPDLRNRARIIKLNRLFRFCPVRPI